MNNEVIVAGGHLPASLSVEDSQLVALMKSTLYPESSERSVKLVLDYCRATQLDPLQRPLHIVKMKRKINGKWQDQENILPGIGLYRVQAARTGAYAGQTEPVFGPEIERELEKVTDEYENDRKVGTRRETVLVRYPEWCKITVMRLVGGKAVKFTAIERWEENYARANNKSTAPNDMWAKRAYGQLAKCTEAQALRKGFPEVGSNPTHEEMEGKHWDDIEEVVVQTVDMMPRAKAEDPAAPSTGGGREGPAEKPQAPPAQHDTTAQATVTAVPDTATVVLSGGQLRVVEGRLKTQDRVSAEMLCKQFNVQELTKIPASQINAVLEFIRTGGAQ